MTAVDNLDIVIEQYHQAAAEFIKGDPEPYKRLFSRRDDVTLGNPFGPTGRGWTAVAGIMDRAAAVYSDGEIGKFDNLAKCVTPELAYIVEVERFRAKIARQDTRSDIALRTTSVFRREDGTWKIVHRQADSITTARPAESVIQK
jgi:ketosteroid isomerase-like protein